VHVGGKGNHHGHHDDHDQVDGGAAAMPPRACSFATRHNAAFGGRGRLSREFSGQFLRPRLASPLPESTAASVALGAYQTRALEDVMKTPLRFAFAISLFAIAAPAIASAQIIEPLKFTTSFGFTAGKTHFGAGTYVARPLDGDPTVVCIQNEHGGPTALLVGIGENPKRDPQKSQVTFVREGDRFVLKSLWDESSSEGVDVPLHPGALNAN
jgi:hypothetical protein